jgi:hypothetical protein
MVTDQQVRRLMKLTSQEKTLAAAAAKAGMDEKTARKYRRLGAIPSTVKVPHTWRTRCDPFAEAWEAMEEQLTLNPGLEAKTLFADLQRRDPGRFADGQLRTLQRRVKTWRALRGPGKEIYFAQLHRPGELGQSDFTHMRSLGVTVQGQAFDHLIYHFVLPYSNWETGTICFSESFESLSEGLQNALWELGGVPEAHRTDRLTPAVQKTDHPDEFTRRYAGLLAHYALIGRKIQAACPQENGDVEQRHHRFKRAVDQALMLRGSRDFVSRSDYAVFLRRLWDQLNAGRRARLAEELQVLRRLPVQRLEACKHLDVRVGQGSTIRVNHNTYSVDSRLIGEVVHIRLYVEQLEVWYGQRCLETIPRLRGENRHHIQYRHVIDWLVRKPGAMANYRYRDDLFPSSRFRLAWDALRHHHAEPRAAKEYLHILQRAALESESAVDQALRRLIDQGQPISDAAVGAILDAGDGEPGIVDVAVAAVDLRIYDQILEAQEVGTW